MLNFWNSENSLELIRYIFVSVILIYSHKLFRSETAIRLVNGVVQELAIQQIDERSASSRCPREVQ